MYYKKIILFMSILVVLFITSSCNEAKKAYISSAKEAIDALHTLQSVVKVGVNHQDYSGRLADAKIKVDKFIRENQTEYIPGLNAKISQAMQGYEDASDWWDLRLTLIESYDNIKATDPKVTIILKSNLLYGNSR